MSDGAHFVRSASGSWYVYAWRGGPRIATVDGGDKPRLTRELEAAIRDARARAAASDETIGGLLRDWRRSPEWEALALTTKRAWSTFTARIEGKWGATPLEVWSDPRMVGKVMAWRDSFKATPRSADEAVKVLSRLLEWGRLRARVRFNVAAGVPTLYRGADRSTIIWTPEDEAAFCRSALMLGLPHVIDVLALASLTGFRRADLAALKWSEVGEHAIVRTALKKSRGRRRRATVPIIPPLAQLLAELRTRPRAAGVDTVLVNSFGRPWGSPVSLGDRFGEVRDHAGIVEPANAELGIPERAKHLHDCRGTYVTHLCRVQPPLTDEQIADLTAWTPANVSEIRKTYVDDAAVVVAIGRRIAQDL
jgi:integrase